MSADVILFPTVRLSNSAYRLATSSSTTARTSAPNGCSTSDPPSECSTPFRRLLPSPPARVCDPPTRPLQPSPVMMKHDTPLPVGVIGTGRMGRLHARTYAKMPEVNLVGVYDTNADSASDVAGEFHTQPFSDVGELLSHVS